MSTQERPVSDSTSPDNRHTFWCEFNQQRRFYYACLHLSDAYDAGRLTPTGGNDCADAMCSGRCNARIMREEELNEEKAIYFTEKTVIEGAVRVDTNSYSYKRGWNAVGTAYGREDDNFDLEDAMRSYESREVRQQSTASKKKQSEFVVGATNMADVINQEIKKESAANSSKEMIARMRADFLEARKTNQLRAKEIFLELKSMGAV